MNISLILGQIIIGLKLLLLICFVVFLLLLFLNKKQPIYYVLLITGCFFVFYLIFSYFLQKTFWGIEGDETFILAFLTRVLHGQYFNDFYYQGLPPFYPPLYFWITGTLARLFTVNAVVAAKIGVLLTIIIAFTCPYLWQKYYAIKNDTEQIISSAWFWVILPFLFFCSLDFSIIITKPYEFLSALLGVIWLGYFYENLAKEKFKIWDYLFFGLIGGLLFLTYYFWWFLLIPVLFILTLMNGNRFRSISRVITTGIIIFIIATIYLLPLAYSFWQKGIENWQAGYFVPSDFNLFMPWFSFSIAGFLSLLGLVSLVLFRKNKFIKASLVLLAACYFYQLANYMSFVFLKKTFQPSKPFLFLGGACLAIGATYGLIYFFNKLIGKYSWQIKKVLIIILVGLSLLPFYLFIGDTNVQAQLKNDQVAPGAKDLAKIIEAKIPDYQDLNWLSSGAPEINAYLPLNYYIAHNASFSHQASLFSERLAKVENLAGLKSSAEFEAELSNLGINALLLYLDKQTNTYPLFFWIDNFPNGGKTIRLDLKPELINLPAWQKVYEDDWLILMKR